MVVLRFWRIIRRSILELLKCAMSRDMRNRMTSRTLRSADRPNRLFNCISSRRNPSPKGASQMRDQALARRRPSIIWEASELLSDRVPEMTRNSPTQIWASTPGTLTVTLRIAVRLHFSPIGRYLKVLTQKLMQLSKSQTFKRVN